MAMRQVAAMSQTHGQNGISRLQGRKIDCHVGGTAAMRLHIGVFGPEQGLGPVDGELFRHIHKLTPGIIALPGIPLGVLVGHHGALRLPDGPTGIILRGNQVDCPELALLLMLDGVVDLGIHSRHRGHFHRRAAHGSHLINSPLMPILTRERLLEPGRKNGFRLLRLHQIAP